MNRKEILLICLILCFICSLQAVASADVSVDDTHDVKLVASSNAIDNDLSSYSHSENNQILRGENDDAGSFSDLQNKINSESGIITLDKNYTFNESLLTDIALASSGIVVQKDSTLAIVGDPTKNITINGLGDSKLFSFKSHVILQNINFINGVGHKTSSITSDDMLEISDCRFFDNTGKLGGAIQANDGLTITDSIFEGNIALDGGSIYVGNSDKASIIENCNFTDSKATTGDAGCIYSNSAHLTLRNLNITDAAAALNGGAMVLNGENTVLDHLYIANCRATNGGAMYYTKAPKQSTYLTFVKNHAFSDGGAVYLLADSTGNGMASGLVNSTFIENIANNEGGALYLVGSNGYMFNVTFKKNTGTTDAGAVMVKGSNWRVYNCTFDTNKVNNRHGGAIYLDSSADTQIWYCNFTSNEASYDGGAVYLYNSSKTTIAYSNFTTNKAGHGGGAVYCNFNSDNSTLTQSRFISNAAYAGDGGGIYWDGNRGDITWSTFRYNRVEGSVGANTGFGGGLAISGIYTNASNCIFEYNHADVGGGGCAVKDSDVSCSSNITVRDSIFEHNDADRDAGGLCWNDNSPYGTAINCTFRYNHAKGSAGALGWHSDYGKVYNSTLEHNYATGQFGSEHPGHGGAMVFRGDHNFAYNCTFYNNTAAKDGGAVYMKLTQLGSNTNITFELCRFINNTANNNGGALAWETGSTYGNVTQCNFTNNTALRSGGAILWEGTYGFIEYSNFTSNKATGDVIDAIGGGDAGVILWIGSHGYVNHCNFTDNFAAYRGGAVFLKGSTNTTFNDTLFKFNVAGTNGGAIDWQEGSHDGRLLNSVFINNTAWRSAGAVYWFGTNGTIYNSNFTNNTAVGNVTVDDRKAAAITYSTVGGNGGAVVWTGSIGNVTKVNFEFNYAERLGGAIFLELNDNVTISYANFTNNTAGINGGAVDWYKGATNGTVKHASFINNTAKRSGGAIYWYGHDGTLYNITFKYNKALGNASYINPFGENTTGGDGGAVFWTGYNGNVTLSKFINNTAVKRGGAVFLQGATDYYCNNTQFKSVLFENNTAGTNGGAVDWFKGATHGVIDNATFRNNVANRSGGAVYWNGDYGDILNSNFTNNRALGISWAINAYGENTTGGSGGAIIWSGSHGIVNNSRFINNTAARHGGAVYMQGTSEENCTNTTYDLCYFEGNNATINGGALDWHENAHEGLVNNSYFINNRAGANGGAVFWLGHDGNITHSNFTSNYALGNVADDYQNQGDGGAVIWGGLNGYVDDCWFKFNNASARGGAVYIHSCEHANNNTHFTNSHFINNTAGTNGGAIDWHAGAENGTVSKTEFINNTAHVNGGAIYWNGINGSIIDSNFTNNSACQNGGAVYWEGNQGLINGSIFKYNNATGYLNSSRIVNYHNDNTGIDEVHYDILGGDGGAIIWKGSQSKIENSTFYKNYAPYRGGAIFFTSLGTENCENVTIKDSNFTLNAAGMNGGAVDWAKGAYNATILSSYFNNNTAGRSAGAIYVSGNDLDIEDTEFNYNKVTGETKYDNRTNVSNYTSIGGNGGAICWMGSYGDLDNVTFLNNTATQRGGAIQFEQNKNTTIENSRFINNTAGTEGGAIDFYKGAVNGKIINSNFTNNAAYENGGAIYWEGHYGTINSTRFENNKVLGLGDKKELEVKTNPDTNVQEKRYNITGGDGGAIKWTGSHGIIENTTFYNNIAEYNGGAVYLIGNATENCTNITFIDCNFTLNLAKLNGGAVYWAKGSSNATVNGTYFDNNTAKRSAGAIYISGDFLNIKDTQFRFNNATMEQTYDNRTGAGFFSSEGGNAGAICWMGSYGTVDNGTFINNTAFKRGGAIQFERNVEGTVKNSLFENNTAGSDGGAIDWYQGAVNGQLVNSTFRTNHVSDSDARGSAVYIEGYNATIKDSRFYEHNSITDGGAVYIEGDLASVENTTFENINTTKKGGAIYVYGDNATITDTNFTNLRANKDGGALYVFGVNCKLSNSTFKNNTAGDDGGAIYWNGNFGTIYNITCVNNTGISYGTSHSKGGTICITSNDTSVDKSTFTDSFTSYNGGAMFITGNNVNITDSDFKNCSVDVTLSPDGDDLPYGGALYVLGENTTVSDCTFDNCTAIQGGIIYVQGNNTKVDNATCGNSSATKYGGAFYIYGVNATISNSSVENTNATLSGGAIYIDGINADIEDSSFEKTNAFGSTTNDGGGAIFIKGDLASVDRSNFTDNGANSNNAKGGAIYITGENVNVTDSKFENSKSKLYGGAIYIHGTNTTIRDSNFTKTSVDGSNSQGGAIYVDGINATIIGSEFEECGAVENGGAVYIHGENTTVQDSYFNKDSVSSSTSKGGAIYVDGINAKIIGSEFDECSAKQQGGSIFIKGANTNITGSNFTKSYISADTSARGGAIYVDGQKTTIAKSEFEDCRANQDGGAIYIKGQFANVMDSNFNGSQAKNGAGLYISGNNATVNGSTFIHGRAGDCGGGIYSDGIGSKVYSSNFTDNKARHTEVQNTGGGAIFWKGGAKDDTIENCTFTANDGGFGGAIRWVNGKDSQASGLIKNCTFISNTGFKGSTVSWASANTAHITLCKFFSNVAEKNGGIYAGTDTSGGGNGFNISNSTFVNNKARCGADIATSVSNAIIINCNFTNSTSGYGGSMVIRERAPKNTQVINCRFVNTSSTGSNDGSRNGGGAIYVAEDLGTAVTENIQIINVTIINSTSNTDGGAIKWGSTGGSGNYGKLINVTIINATATSTWDKKYDDYGKGGAIYWLAPYGEFRNVTVINANSRNDGGAIYIEGGNCNIFNSSISNSVANKSGGAIYWNGANGIVSNTNFTNNSALGTGGGAIYWAGANGQVLSSLFTENNAVDGGAIYWTGTNAKLDNSTFIKNHATNGGAVYWKSSSSTFTNNKFYNNTAKYGGGIYWNAAGETMTNTIMMYNRAVNGSAIYTAAIAKIVDAILLENQAKSYEIYNRATTIIERNADDTVTIFTYFRGGDNVLNAIYNAAYISATQTISFRNVTYLGVGGRKNTAETTTVYPVFTHNDPSEIANDGRIYQTNLEVEQDIYAYAYDGDNVLQMNATGKTNYNGSVYYVTSIANAGEVNVKVYHPEDNYYTYIAFANNTKLPTVILEVNDIYFQETEYLNITVRPEVAGETDKLCPGNVTVYLNGELYAANVSLIENPDGVTGSVTIPIKDLHVNKYNVYVAYSGNKKYIPEYNSTSFRVLKIPSWITVTVDDYYYGDMGKAIIETIKNTTANVTAIINGKEYRLEVNETGHAEILIPLLDAGNYTAEAYYLDSNDCFASNATDDFEIFKVNSTINITGEYLNTLNTVKIYIDVGPADTVGKVSVWFENKQYNVTLTNSKAELTLYAISAGPYNVTAEYYGDRNHFESLNNTTLYANKFKSAVEIDVTNITYGDNETIVFTVTKGATGNLTITFNGKTFNKTIDANGKVILENLKLAAGNYTVNATYGGDDNYYGSYGENNFTVAKAIPVLEPVVENITYVEIEHIIAKINQTGNVSIIIRSLIDPNVIITQNLTINITNKHNVTWNVSGLARGDYIAQFIFSGNQNYTGCEVNATFAVGWATPIIIVEVNDTITGNRAPINITVYPRENVTGNVSVYLDGVKLGEFDLVDGFIRLPGEIMLVNGTHDVVAVYNGDNNFTHAHNSTTFEVTGEDFRENPKFNLTATNVTVLQNGEIQINLPADATGMVFIKVNDTQYYVNLSESRTLTLPLLGNGTYTVWANYTGDAKWHSAVNTTRFTVSKVNTTVDINVVQPIVYDNYTNITVTVENGVDGFITLTINDGTKNITNITLPVVDGKVNWIKEGLGAGSYTVYANYSGSARYNINDTESKNFVINQAAPVFSVDVVTVDANENAIVKVKVNDTMSGTLNITVYNKNYTADIIEGIATFTIDKLPVNQYDVNVTYKGDNNYTYKSQIFENRVIVTKVTCYPINVTAIDVLVGVNTTITVHVPKDATGTVTVWVNGTGPLTNSTIRDGVATFTLNKTISGRYEVNATLSNSKYADKTAYTNFWVSEHETPITIDVNPIYVGDKAIIEVTVPSGVINNVTIELEGKAYNKSVDSTTGKARFEVQVWSNGTRTVVATYGGDNKYLFNSTTANFTVTKRTPVLDVTATGNSVGSNATISVSLPTNATGYVTVNVNGTNYTIKLNDGAGSVQIAGLGNGTYYVHATYIGDRQYFAASNNDKTFEMTKLDTTMDIAVTDIDYGQKANITVTITNGATGFITIRINETRNITLPIGNGKVNWIVDGLAADNYTVYANYSGDGKYNINNTDKVNKSFEVRQITPVITIETVEVNSARNATVVVHITPGTTGKINITVNNENYSGPIENGVARIVIKQLNEGNYQVFANYTGDKNFTNASITQANRVIIHKFACYNMTVIANDTTVGANTTIVVNVPDDAVGNVSIYIDGVFVNNATISQGVAKLNVTKDIAGKYVVNATFTDGKYANKTVTTNYHVLKIETPIEISVNPIYVGDNAIIEVTVPAGVINNVSIEINGIKYNKSVNNQGKAIFEVSDLTYGNKTVVATYGGDNKYLFNSTTQNFTVNKRDTGINITVEDITYGGKVNITVNVTAEAGGFITIRINETRNITLPIVTGKVNWIVEDLAVDNYTIYAAYEGDAKYNINSTDKAFKVIQATPTITIESVEVNSARNATVVVRIDSKATGNINITVNGQNYSGPIENGVARIIIDQLNEGNYTVIANYTGDRNFTNASATQDNAVNVHKFACYDMNVTAHDSKVGVNTTIVVNLPVDAVGNVSIYVNGSFVGNATVSSGVATLSLNKTIAGKYVVNATFSDGKYANKTVTTNFYVIKWETPMSITVSDAKVGDNVEVIVSLPADINGETVTIEINGKKYVAQTDNNGNATFTVPCVTYGNKTVVAIYNGNSKYVFNSTTENFTVDKRESQVNVTYSASVVGMDTIINVTIPANATGYVIVNINGTNYTVNTTNGNGSLVIKNLGNGNYWVNVTYIGDDQYYANTNRTEFSISRLPTEFKVNGTDITYGGKELITIETADNITAKVIVEINDKNYTAIVYEGKGNLTVENLAAGNYNVTVYFEGNYKYLNTTANNTFTVSKATIPVIVIPQNITYGDVEILTILVNGTGKVNITVDDVIYRNKQINNGRLEFELLGYLTAGNYTVIVDYGGNENYTKNSAEANFTVAKKDPAITVEVQNITYGDIEHIIVHVNAPGNVTIRVNNTEVTIVLKEGEGGKDILRTSVPRIPTYDVKATLDVYNLAAGTYPVEVTYNGAENYNKASATTFFVVGKQNTTVDVAVDNITVADKQVINVTISDVNATGNVTINVDGVNYTRPIVNGTANLTLDKVSAGNHSVVVIYDGNNNFIGNWTSATFNVDKIKPDLTIEVTNTTVGKTERVIIRLPDNATGFVVVDVDGTKYHIDIIKGQEIALEIDDLINKTYNVAVEYSGDEFWDSANNSTSFNVNGTKADISVKVENITIGDKAIINITAPKDLYGNVTVTVDDKNYTVYVAGGNGILIVPDLGIGNYTVDVTFDGNDKYGASKNTTSFEISKVNITSDDIKVIDQGNGTVVVVVPGNATGNVTIYVDGQNFTGEVINGTATINLENVTPGKQNITVVYEGDDTHNNATVNSTVVIPKLDSRIAINVTEIKEGGNGTVTVTVPGNATGNVTIYVDGQNFTGEVINGTATVTIGNLTAGNKTIVVEYSGDANHTANYTISDFTVGEVKVVPDIKVIDQGNGTVVVVVGDNATGNVTVKVGDKEFNATVVNGTAVVDVGNLTPGNNTVEVIYSGDDAHTNATVVTVINGPKYDSPINVTVGEVKEGENATVTVTVPGNATGNVTVTIDGQKYTAEVINGTATVTVENLTAGPKSVLVEYAGDGNYTANYTSSDFTVDKANVTPEIVVVDQGNGTVVVVVGDNATGNVTVKVGDKEFNATVVNGTAVVNITNVTPGDHEVEVIYSGDGNHTNATVKANITAPKYDAPINVTVSEAKEGEDIVITVEVPKGATGNVTVSVGGKDYTAEIDDGKAVVTAKNVSDGDHTIAVEYLGDGNYSAGHAVSNMTVQKAKADTEPSVIDYGNGTVVVVVGDNATGNVTIKVGDHEYNATVVNGTAVVTIDNETPGTHEVEVIYSGDGNHTNSTITTNITAPKYDAPMNVVVGSIVNGTAVVTVTVPENATGNVTIRIDGMNYTAKIDNGGKAVIKLENLTGGAKTFIVEYPGDNNFTGNYTVGEFVAKGTKASVDPVIVDNGNGTIVVVIGDNATGNVTIKVGNETFNATVVNGTAIINITNVTPGDHEVEVIYSGDANHTNSTIKTNITAPKYDTPMNVVVGSIVNGTAVVTVTVPENATGNVTIRIDGMNYTAKIDNGGKAVIKLENLTGGAKTFIVEYPGDNNFTGNYTVGEFVAKGTKASVDPVIVDNGNGTIVVVIGDNATGNVTIKVGNETFNATVVNGTAIINITNVTPGTHEVEVIYSGDDNHTGTTINTNVTAPKYDTPINVTVGVAKEGEPIIITVEVPKGATGNVTVSVGGKDYTAEIDADGKAVVTAENVSDGDHTIAVEYLGDKNYSANHTVSNMTVQKAKTDTEPSVIDYGNGTVVVVVGDNATGDVTIKVGDKEFNATVVNGTAVVTIDNVTPGSHEVEVIYSGDGNHTGSTITTNITAPKYDTNMSMDITELPNGTVVVTVTVPDNAAGDVTVNVGGKEYKTKIDDNGNAVVYVDDISSGDHTIVVEYSGDDNYAGNYTISNFTKKEGKAAVDPVIVDYGNGTIVVVVGDNATGNVTVKVGDNIYNATVVNGTAIITLDNETPGVHDVEVIYSGDGNHTNATIHTEITVSDVPTPIKINVDNINVGDKAIITVEVPKGATGSITIEIDGVNHTSLINGGVARFEVENLTAGEKSVFAVYEGDGAYARNFTSAQFNVSKVNSNLIVEISDVNVGENITVTVKVPTDATGQVLIDIDGVGYYVNITGGIGTVEIPHLGEGNYNVNLTYLGDDKYLSSSNKTTVKVSKLPSFVIPTVSNIHVGENENIQLLVPTDATGNVTVIINSDEFTFNLNNGALGAVYVEGKEYIVAVSGGNGELVISGLPKGEYSVRVIYNGDNKYLPSENATIFAVSKQDTQMDVIDQGNGTIKVILPDDATGNVTVDDGKNKYVVEVVNGTAVINLNDTTPGKHDVTVEYSGDGDYSSNKTTISVDIPKYSTPISVDVSNIKVGETEVVTVTLPKGATGTVTIEINGKEYTAKVKDGIATFSVTGLAFGDKTVAVKYAGDDYYMDNYTTAQFTVSKVSSTVKATGKDINVGKDEIITATVPKDATGRVLVDIDGVGYYGTVENGKAKIIIPELASGKYTTKITYEGDDKYLPSTTTVSFKVSKVNAPISADADDIYHGEDATVVVNVPEDATGTVTITVNGKTYTQEVKNGKAIFTVPGLTKGDYDIIASYSGDRKYDANDSITDIEVHFNETPDEPAHPHYTYNAEKRGLEKYPTGNPILALILMLLIAVGFGGIRKFRK